MQQTNTKNQDALSSGTTKTCFSNKNKRTGLYIHIKKAVKMQNLYIKLRNEAK